MTNLDSPPLAACIKSAPILPLGKTVDRIIKTELLDRIDESDLKQQLAALTQKWPLLAALSAGILAHAPFLAQAMRLAPASLFETLESDPDTRLDHLLSSVQAKLSQVNDIQESMPPLRQMRRDVAVLVALADIGGIWTVEKVTHALTRAADLAVSLAADISLRQAATLGRIKLLDPATPGPGSGLVILGLGKHGAGELNYSSDIDLVIFFDPEAANIAGIAEPTAFFARVARDITKMLQERTGDGYVHRVDLRLRPDPASTPPAVPLPSAYAYYESVGQNWERAAFIKARAVAGDLVLGQQFLDDLRPFIWRKYFDYAAIADIHAMKRQIQAVKGHETIAVAGHDVKLGRGGIREIEFFVQTQQLVFGGREPALRGRKTLDMLEMLARKERISALARDELGASYRFLRTIEHRLQMRHDEQTQRLPVDLADLDAFSRFAGFKGRAAFGKALRKMASTVECHYSRLFEAGPSLAAEAGTLSFVGVETDPETRVTLERLGFRNAEQAAETVRGWHFGRRPAVTSSRAREALTELAPALLVALGRTSSPDAALASLDRAFERMPAAVELLSLLKSNTSFLTLFAEMLGSAPRLADVLSSHPHVLDGVIDPGFAKPSLSTTEIAQRISGAIGTQLDFAEEFLDHLRDAVRPEIFLVGARLLSGIISPAQAGEAYAAVAQATVQVALAGVRRFFENEHGVIPKAQIAILAMGRLGSGDLTAHSDLDLIFIYDRPEDSPSSDGLRPLDPVSYHIRLAQRLIAALSAPTRRGKLYEVDLRLRPDGNKSPPATQLSRLISYYDGNAETWEEMALTKARVIAGDPTLGEELRSFVARVLTRKRAAAKVAVDVRSMRALIATAKGDDDPWNLKLAAGGLTDLDFLAEYIALAHAHVTPKLLKTRSDLVFKAAQDSGLLTVEDGTRLVEAFELFDSVTQWQRFAWPENVKADDVTSAMLMRIAAITGLPDGRQLKAHLDETRHSIKAIVERLIP